MLNIIVRHLPYDVNALISHVSRIYHIISFYITFYLLVVYKAFSSMRITDKGPRTPIHQVAETFGLRRGAIYAEQLTVIEGLKLSNHTYDKDLKAGLHTERP